MISKQNEVSELPEHGVFSSNWTAQRGDRFTCALESSKKFHGILSLDELTNDSSH